LVCDIKGRTQAESVGELRKLRKLSRPKREKVIGGWRRINKEYVYEFNVHVDVHRKSMLIYIHQNATLDGLLYLETALHVSGGTSTHHQERI
jgi:hypothetical protein